jgi:hypothetical protein
MKMKKRTLLILIPLFLFAVLLLGSIPAYAVLITPGTASYGGSNYNLIFDNDLGLVWLDYTHTGDSWDNQMSWAAGLNASGVLTYNLNPEYSVTWNGNWRLPTTPGTSFGYTSQGEMGHLYWGEGISASTPGLFTNLVGAIYWTGTEFVDPTIPPGRYGDPNVAWYYDLLGGGPHTGGGQSASSKDHPRLALAVREMTISTTPPPPPVTTPEPTTMLLLGLGLVGLAGVRRKFKA